MSRGTKKVSLVPQYVKMMGIESTWTTNNDKLGRTNCGPWKFWLKNILIQENAPLHGPQSKQRCDGKPSYHCTRTAKNDDDHPSISKKWNHPIHIGYQWSCISMGETSKVVWYKVYN